MHARAIILLLLLAAGVVACSSPIRTALCGLASYAADIDADLEALLALDPEQVAQAGTPDNAAALEILDRLDATAAEGQAALDAASEDDVGEAVRRLFQAALDATGLATDALRTSIDSGDPEAVTQAMGQVRIASDAIGAFVAAVDELGVRCPSASPSAAPSEATSAPASAEPTETAAATPEPTSEPTSTPTAQPTATSSPTPEPTAAATVTASPTASPTPTPSPTATPTASPTASLTASASASASESASAEPTPAPSAGSTEDGGMNLAWLLVLGAGALGAVAYVLFSRSRTPPPEGGGAAAAEAAPIEEAPEDLPPPQPPTSPEG
jgi:hypothetical protein